MKQIEEQELDYIELSRARRPLARLTRQAVSYAATTVSNLFRPIYFCVLDVAIQELEERFTDNGDLKFYRAMEDLLLSGVVDARTP